ncbi:AraC family transcriptional regulator [Pseudomonas carassii]|jgi:AraC-like DNA-binding protein|uniref:AraC family transcriptional regulator n=1 Tax=Pseudomonas carassii TaxID=3115855 RepID=A0ABU7H5U1_9PSED|nr:AraC family transcriptional regulator [Pseudomonas sp. 137P]MEE1886650.1 AraC family transcriptional regulator [Pseudomonas sp. 137P]
MATVIRDPGDLLPPANAANTERSPGKDGDRRCIQRTLAYINDNLHSAITLTELSTVFGACRCRFAARFKQHTGYTPHAYILHRKIIRAQEMLRQTDNPIIEVALDLGFNSQPHFTSAFRNEVGITPARWRHENR